MKKALITMSFVGTLGLSLVSQAEVASGHLIDSNETAVETDGGATDLPAWSLIIALADGPMGNGFTYPEGCIFGGDLNDVTGEATFALNKPNGTSDQMNILTMKSQENPDKSMLVFGEAAGKTIKSVIPAGNSDHSPFIQVGTVTCKEE